MGCIDGTHIRIRVCYSSLSPSPRSANTAQFQVPNKDERSFVNRKMFHSLNVQVVCDSTFAWTNVVVRFPGSTHDSHIWRTSNLRADFENGRLRGYLLGDEGYGREDWLHTPIPKPRGRDWSELDKE